MEDVNSRNEKGQFVKGRIETEEEKLKRIKAFQESWKDRPGYIADIRDECPKLYNIWRAFRFTEKGKKVGNSEEWNNYRTFYNDTRPFYKEGLVFRRKDTTKPFSKENFMFITTEEAGQLHTIQIEYKGQLYTFKQLAELSGNTTSSIKNRYYKHPEYTIEEIIFGR